ncbi:phasin family protein [Erythrobacter sp.]|uniref:phasin family protein n=1 Tax=Erythrobacter sp. TaxID=1042 RepID=UPI002EA41F61|nr:TIGR01841 family phasin [Erythrobacter sp.]
MADAPNQSKIDAAAEKAYAEAAAKKSASERNVAENVADAIDDGKATPAPDVKEVAEAVAAPEKKAAPAKKAPVKKSTRKTVAKTRAARTSSARKTAPKKTGAAKRKTATSAKKAGANGTATRPAQSETKTNPISKLKETIMANAKTTDIPAQAKEMAADMQTRMKGAYEKASELAADAGEFNKANLEAFVESGKILVAGTQEIVKSDVETGKSMVETVTEDAKKMAAVKSPTELFQLQGELARRNFDAAVSFGSQRTETILKLYNDAFAPISNRMSVAAEKVSKAA